MKYSKCTKINEFIDNFLVEHPGFTYRKGKHGKLSNGKVTIIVPGTPSDRRAHLNFRKDVRRVLTAI